MFVRGSGVLPCFRHRSILSLPSRSYTIVWYRVAETSWIMAVTCADFKKLDDFRDYISQLRNETGFNSTILQQCQAEICTTLYGIGNPDMSGIGVRRIPFPDFPGPEC